MYKFVKSLDDQKKHFFKPTVLIVILYFIYCKKNETINN